MKTMNLLRIVTSQSWGADMEIGMRLYRAIIRSKIDYRSIVYGAANAATLNSLEVVANEAMRIRSRQPQDITVLGSRHGNRHATI